MQLVNRIAVAIFILDQLSKYLVVHVMRLDQRQEVGVFPPFLNFRMAWNQGINFGLFQSGADVMRWVLIAVALVIAAWVWLWVRRERHQPRVLVSAGLLIGGIGQCRRPADLWRGGRFPEHVDAGDRQSLFLQRGRRGDIRRCAGSGVLHGPPRESRVTRPVTCAKTNIKNGQGSF